MIRNRNLSAIINIMHRNGYSIISSFAKTNSYGVIDTYLKVEYSIGNSLLFITLFNNCIIVDRRIECSCRDNYAYVDYFKSYNELDEIATYEQEEFISYCKKEKK